MRPVTATRVGAPVGTLVLIGGSCSPHGAALQAFNSAVDAVGGPVIGISAASGEPERSEQNWLEAFGLTGRDISFPQFTRSDPSSDAALAERIDDAAAVFLAGGNQVKLVTEMSGTLAEHAMKRLLARGGVVGGTSAGAAALTELTMAGGEVDAEGVLVEQYIGPGFGLLGFNTIVDTHFSERRRLQRLTCLISQRPDLYGVGIDEDTALMVRGCTGEVFGAGSVTFVDGRDSLRFDNADALGSRRSFTLTNVRIDIVGASYPVDLARRELEILLEDRAPRRSFDPSTALPAWHQSW